MSELTPETLPIWDEAHEKTAQALVQLAEMNESFGEAYKAWRYIDKIDSHWHIAQLLLWRKLDLDAQKADRAHLEALEMTLAFYGRCGLLGFDGGARARAALRGGEKP